MFRSIFIALSENKTLRGIAERSKVGRRLSSRFVAGTTVDEVLAATKAVNALGMSVSIDNLGELWALVGRDRSSEDVRFFAENGEEPLRRHFDSVERRDVIGEMSFTREAVRDYVANSIGHAHLVDSIPEFDEPLGVTRHMTIFVATK